jgi:type II secretory pathway pseudopilin PulG
MRKLPAFTLLEVILSLFLVGMLGVFATYVLRGLQQGTRDATGRSAHQQELLFLSAAVRTDMDRSQALHAGPDGALECVVDSGSVWYTVVPQGIRRTLPNGDTATFALPVQHAQALSIAADLPLIHLWKVQFTEEGGGEEAAFHKTYAPADLVREKTEHGHPDTHGS